MQTVYRMEKEKQKTAHPAPRPSFRGCINVAIIGGRKVSPNLKTGLSACGLVPVCGILCVESCGTQDTRRRIVVWTNARFELNTRRLIDSRDPNAGLRINKRGARRRYTQLASLAPRNRSVPRAENSREFSQNATPAFHNANVAGKYLPTAGPALPIATYVRVSQISQNFPPSGSVSRSQIKTKLISFYSFADFQRDTAARFYLFYFVLYRKFISRLLFSPDTSRDTCERNFSRKF